MRFRKRPSRRVFGLSLTEVALLLVFLLLALLAASITEDDALAAAREDLASLVDFHDSAQEVLDTLGVSLDGLREVASRLVAADLVEKSKLNLAKLIDRLLAENRRLRSRVGELEMRTDDLTYRAEAAGRELTGLGKATGEGGTEPGSCWFDVDGRVEYFLDVIINDDRLNVRPAWPSIRRTDLEALGVSPSAVLSGDVENEEFSRFAEPIYHGTVDRGCRLFARVVDRTTNKEAYKHQIRLVERFFFVREVDQ